MQQVWRSQVEIIKPNRIQKIRLLAGEHPLTYAETVELWQRDRDFCLFFNSLLVDAPFPAFFWETPPINLANIERDFEFVLIDSPQLAKVKPNPNSFKKYFNAATPQETVITFPNLRKDALLVVPCPQENINIYPHLASFVRQAAPSQIISLWQTLGNSIKGQLSNKNLWVSTSGLGVYWLHLRLDSSPKYYHFQPYK